MAANARRLSQQTIESANARANAADPSLAALSPRSRQQKLYLRDLEEQMRRRPPDGGGVSTGAIAGRRAPSYVPPDDGMDRKTQLEVLRRQRRERASQAEAAATRAAMDRQAREDKARSRDSHWSPYDPIGVVNAVP